MDSERAGRLSSFGASTLAVRRWSLSDDVERGEAIDAATTEGLRTLVHAVDRSVLRAIDGYLDQFHGQHPEEVVWLHDIAQASIEASFELARRRAGDDRPKCELRSGHDGEPMYAPMPRSNREVLEDAVACSLNRRPTAAWISGVARACG